jgi:hypothetical protein
MDLDLVQPINGEVRAELERQVLAQLPGGWV